jgi:hypothetical protein
MKETEVKVRLRDFKLTNPSTLPNLMSRCCRSKNCTCKILHINNTSVIGKSLSRPYDIGYKGRNRVRGFEFQGLHKNQPSTSLDPHSVESDNRIAGVAVLSVYMSNRKE